MVPVAVLTVHLSSKINYDEIKSSYTDDSGGHKYHYTFGIVLLMVPNVDTMAKWSSNWFILKHNSSFRFFQLRLKRYKFSIASFG